MREDVQVTCLRFVKNQFDEQSQSFADVFEEVATIYVNVGSLPFDTQMNQYGDYSFRRYSLRSTKEIPKCDKIKINSAYYRVIAQNKYSVRVERDNDESIEDTIPL